MVCNVKLCISNISLVRPYTCRKWKINHHCQIWKTPKHIAEASWNKIYTQQFSHKIVFALSMFLSHIGNSLFINFKAFQRCWHFSFFTFLLVLLSLFCSFNLFIFLFFIQLYKNHISKYLNHFRYIHTSTISIWLLKRFWRRTYSMLFSFYFCYE